MSQITYSWAINKLEYVTEENNLSNVVKYVHWTYSAKENGGNQETLSCSNIYPLPPPSPDNFIDFVSLTEEQVIQWLESNLDISTIQNNLSKEIDLKYKPLVTTNVFPWRKVKEIPGPPIDVIPGPPIDDVPEPPIDDVPEPPINDVPEPPINDVPEPPIDVIPGPPIDDVPEPPIDKPPGPPS